MATFLQRHDSFIHPSAVLQNYVDYAERSTLRVLRSKQTRSSTQVFFPCNNARGEGKNTIVSFCEDRELPLPETSCYTDYIDVAAFSNESVPFTTKQIFDAMGRRQSTLHKYRNSIANDVLGNWSEPDTNFAFRYTISSKQCTVHVAAGLRVGRKWYLGTTLTNTGRTRNVPLFGRQWLTEYLHTACNGTRLEALLFSTRKRPPEGNGTHLVMRNTTTSLATGRGSLGPYAFLPQYPEENIALISAMDKSDRSIQQVDDALAPSSLAILLMPLALNLIPIALLADVQSLSMLLYTLMSDIVTVIPLSIKGVELIIIGRQHHISSAIRFTTSISGALSSSAGMEMWSAECRALDYVFPTGLAFLILAISFMIVGVALEFVAKYYLARRRIQLHGADFEDEPFLGNSEVDSGATSITGDILPVGAQPNGTAEANGNTGRSEYNDVVYAISGGGRTVG